MPKILRIINRFNLGGITYNVSYLSRYLPPGYETLLIGGPEEDGEESSLFIPSSMGLRPVIIGEMRRSVNPVSDFYAYRRIKRIIREYKPDIVHTHASKAGAVGRLAAAHCRVPVIVHTFHGHVFHGYFGKIRTAIYKTIERFLARRTDAIVAISRLQKEELSQKHGICAPGKITVIPLGFDLARFSTGTAEKRQEFRRRYHVTEDEIAVGIIGRLAPIKNHFLFIDAVAFVLKHSNRKIRAFIIGDGETREDLISYAHTKVTRTSTDPAQNADLVFTGWIREADVAMAGLDIVCLTSNNEGTPVSLIEAQATGRFIVSTDVGGIGDILHPGCGFLSPAGDRGQFCENLLRAVNDFGQLAQGAKTAVDEVRQKFGYERLCSEMDGLYRRLLDAKKR